MNVSDALEAVWTATVAVPVLLLMVFAVSVYTFY